MRHANRFQAGNRGLATYRDTFRSHRVLFILPIIVSLVTAAWFAFGAAPTYRSTASLWVDNGPAEGSSLAAMASPTASADQSDGSGDGEDNGATESVSVTPARIEHAVLTELLASPQFTLTVGRDSLLPRFDASGLRRGFSPAVLLTRIHGSPVDRAAEAVATKVTSRVEGPQVLELAYTGPTPAVARSVLASVIQHLHTAPSISGDFALTQQAFFQQAQGDAARAAANAAASAAAYLREHRSATAQTDPNYGALLASVKQTNRAYAAASAAIRSTRGGRAGGKPLLTVIDPPSLPAGATVPLSQTVLGLAGGLFAGLMISFLAAVVATPDHQRRWDQELATGRWLGRAYIRPSPAQRTGTVPNHRPGEGVVWDR